LNEQVERFGKADGIGQQLDIVAHPRQLTHGFEEVIALEGHE
jgi:hypothetical protein